MGKTEIDFHRAKAEMGPAIKTALARFVSETDRPDVEAEINASIWTALQRFEGESTLKTYLYPVVRRRIADYFRAKYRKAKLLRKATTELRDQADGLPVEDLDIVLLSPAELRVFRCIADGSSNGEICAELHVCLDTVRTHVKHLYKKTGAPNRARLTLLAHRFWKEEK